MLLAHLMRPAASRIFWTAGKSRPIRMPMMAITTSSSTSVKPVRCDARFIDFPRLRKGTKRTSASRRLYRGTNRKTPTSRGYVLGQKNDLNPYASLLHRYRKELPSSRLTQDLTQIFANRGC